MNKRSSAWKKYNRDLEIYHHEQAGASAEQSGDIALAIEELEKAAARGSTYARGKLGTIYDEAVDPPQHQKAVYWYKAGVRLGDSSCAWDLAMHYSALGRKRWYHHWLQVAERMGEPGAAEEIKEKNWWKKHNPK